MTIDTDVGAVNAGNQEIMKGRQENEAANRLAANGIEVTDGPAEDVVVSDSAPPPADGAAPPQEPPPPTKPRWFQDEMRDSIVQNFRRKRDVREQEQDEDAKEIQEFMRSGGMPKEFQDTFVDDQLPEGEAEPPEAQIAEPEQPAPPQQPSPRKIKIKVNGKEQEVTEEELIARVQKSEAADERLEEAKELVRELKAAKRDLESRPSPTATPAADSAATQGQPSPTGDPNQIDPYKETAEALLYGDPDIAAAKVRDLLARVVPNIAMQTVASDRARSELSRSNANAARFSQENEELAKDPMARAAIKQAVIDNQREDLVTMGVDPAKIQSDNDVMNMHLSMRSNPSLAGTVRTTEKLFEDAKGAYMKWRGVTPTPAPNGNAVNGNGANPQRTATPTLEVDVNRTARRQAIQPQPSRTAVLRAAAPPAPQQKTRSQIIAEMRKQRGQEI